MRFQDFASACALSWWLPGFSAKSHLCRVPEASGTECSTATWQPLLCSRRPGWAVGPRCGGWQMSRAVSGGKEGGTSTKQFDAVHSRDLGWRPKPHFGSAWPGIPTPGTPSSQRGPFPISPPAIFLASPLSQDPLPGLGRSCHVPW